MLLYFSVRNFKTFYETENGVNDELITFSMLPTREQFRRESCASPRAVGVNKVLPITALYGANAYGKSSLLQAVGALQKVVNPDKNEPIPYLPNHLYGNDEPTTFEISFVAYNKELGEEKNYIYRIEYDDKRVYYEALLVGRSRYDTYIFERSWDEDNQSFTVEYDNALRKDERAGMIRIMLEEKEVLLYELYRKANLAVIDTVWEWIILQVTVVPAGADYSILPLRLRADKSFVKELCEVISKTDTGISDITFVDVPFPERLRGDLPENVKKSIFDGDRIVFSESTDGDIYLLSANETKKIEVKQLITVHKHGEKEFNLPFSQESDGTVRYMHLFPIFLDLQDEQSRSVYLIDEIDTSLHSNLIINFIGKFLDSRGCDSRSQLIFTTHNLEIMGQDNLLRRDEKWIVDKKTNGASQLSRVTDYAIDGVRNTSDIIKIYSHGMMGGTPNGDWNRG